MATVNELKKRLNKVNKNATTYASKIDEYKAMIADLEEKQKQAVDDAQSLEIEIETTILSDYTDELLKEIKKQQLTGEQIAKLIEFAKDGDILINNSIEEIRSALSLIRPNTLKVAIDPNLKVDTNINFLEEKEQVEV